ncbi:MAG: hypothetical protein KIT14_16780 [bacterium]|nr:hypothetical protein [bacterium]
MLHRGPMALALAVSLAVPALRPWATTAGTQVPAASPAKGSAPEGTYDKWAWFADTYWIVPEAGIYSIYHPLGTAEFVVARGQTVFHVTDYFNGYFTGTVVVKLTGALVPTCQYMLGQVTPQKRVYLTMYDVATGVVTNTPLGHMVKKHGRWTMVNQMTGPAAGGTLSHWAYMVQSKPGDASFTSLPFAGESIPTFLAGCPPGPTIRLPD